MDKLHYFRTIQSSNPKKEIESPIGKNDNSRWNRNRLYQTKSEDTQDNHNLVSTVLASSACNTDSVLTIEAIKDSPADSLRKKVIQRLIGVNSPKNENKKKLFNMLVKNEDNTKVIIDMALDMGSSVEDTKKMLINNCI